MNTAKVAAIILIAAGVLGLIYGGFSYTKKTNKAKIGSIELAVKEKKNVNIPIWMGVGAIAAGGAILVATRKRN